MLLQLLLYLSIHCGLIHSTEANAVFMNFAKTEGHSLVGHVTARYQVPDDIACAFKCVLNSSCISFNYGGEKNNGRYTCELSNSDKFIHPNNFTSRQGFLYSGANTPSRCFSAPCVNGGTCSSTRDSFTCTCPLAIRVLPYTDHRCSVDNSRVSKTSSVAGVFGVQAGGNNQLTYYEAQRLCEILGGDLASYDQLYQAWQAGMQWCAWAWLNDATVRFPMQGAVSGCSVTREIKGNTTPHPKTEHWNALCYKP